MPAKNSSQDRMGSAPINKLLLSVSVPLIISMLVQALYNIVDSLFVSQLSQDAFNAVSLSFPVQNIMIAIAGGTCTGLVALISRSLGEQNREKANKYAVHGIFLMLFSYIAIVIFAILCTDFFFRSQTDIAAIISDGKDYLMICCIFSFGLFGQLFIERIMQSVGRSMLSMWTQLTGALINIIFDPIFIFEKGDIVLGFEMPFGFGMGASGAAVATVLGQIIGMIVGILLLLKYNKELSFKLKGFRLSGKMIANIYKIGIPNIVTIGIGSVMTYLMNKLLIDIEPTATAAAVFGAYFKLQSFVCMPTIGLSQGMMPIVGYNFGAKKKKRMLKAYHLSIVYAMIIMVIGTALSFFIPDKLLTIFNATEHMLEIGTPAFKIISISYIFIAYGIITSNLFMSCGRSILSLVMSFCRQLILLIPIAYILGYTVGYEYVWYSIPLSELGCSFIAIFGRIRIQRTLISALPDED